MCSFPNGLLETMPCAVRLGLINNTTVAWVCVLVCKNVLFWNLKLNYFLNKEKQVIYNPFYRWEQSLWSGSVIPLFDWRYCSWDVCTVSLLWLKVPFYLNCQVWRTSIFLFPILRVLQCNGASSLYGQDRDTVFLNRPQYVR